MGCTGLVHADDRRALAALQKHVVRSWDAGDYLYSELIRKGLRLGLNAREVPECDHALPRG
jgi:hypothetical protein